MENIGKLMATMVVRMTEEKTWLEKYNLFISTLVIVLAILALWWDVSSSINDNTTAIVQNRERIIQIGEKIDSFKDYHQREHDLFYGLPANAEANTEAESETP